MLNKVERLRSSDERNTRLALLAIKKAETPGSLLRFTGRPGGGEISWSVPGEKDYATMYVSPTGGDARLNVLFNALGLANLDSLLDIMQEVVA